MTFADSKNGTVVGGVTTGGLIIRTTNAGESWITPPCPTCGALNAVCFPSSEVGIAVGEAGTILRTTNGGDHWAVQWSGSAKSSLADVCFTDLSNGVIVGSEAGRGIVLRTTDGGSTWGQLTLVGAPGLRGACFPDKDTGWVVGADGWMSKTTDGGSSWERTVSGTYRSMSAVHFGDAKTGWAVGDGGTILKSVSGSVTSAGRGEAGNELPEFSLDQNYPNPFNPVTTVSYRLPALSRVKLAVYDLLGREVAVLVDEEQPTGRYSTVLDVGKLPSGVYLYRLQAGVFSETRRMVLVR
jgi:hypothetical protein